MQDYQLLQNQFEHHTISTFLYLSEEFVYYYVSLLIQKLY
jgi:hypothetical protein